MLDDVRPEALVDALVAALAGEVDVEVAERRREGVGVAQRVGPALAVVDLDLVAQRQRGAGDDALEDAAGVDLLERRALAARP